MNASGPGEIIPELAKDIMLILTKENRTRIFCQKFKKAQPDLRQI
jgi:hypothetical protein